MLVSGVWRLWLTPRRKSSLAASSSRSCAFWVSTCSNSWAFRTPTAISLANSSSRSWSARSQRRVAGSRPSEDARARPTRRGGGAQGPRLAGDDLLLGHGRRVAQDDDRVDHPERRLGVGPRRARRGPRPRRVADRAGSPRGCSAELPVAPLEVGGEAVVALGEAGQLVVAGDPDRRRQVAGRDPVDRRRDRPQRRR